MACPLGNSSLEYFENGLECYPAVEEIAEDDKEAGSWLKT